MRGPELGIRTRLLGAVASLALGCGGGAVARPVPPTRAPPAPAVESGDALATGPLGIFRSKRFDLAIPIPDGRGFAIDDTRGNWLSARHEGSRSTILLRRWRVPELTSRDGCEAAARNGRTLPTLDAAEVLEVRSLAVPPGHDTEASVALFRPRARPGESPPLFGMVLAFGSSARQCFAFAFVTEHAGPDAEAVVAARLARVVDQSLARIEAKSDLDPRLEREVPAPSRPR